MRAASAAFFCAVVFVCYAADLSAQPRVATESIGEDAHGSVQRVHLGVDPAVGAHELRADPRELGRELDMTVQQRLVGGGKHPDTYVALCTADGKEVLRASGSNSLVLQRIIWDVTPYQGDEVFLRVVDRREKKWAHITFDDFSAEGLCLAFNSTRYYH